jgi:hypothetical protein
MSLNELPTVLQVEAGRRESGRLRRMAGKLALVSALFGSATGLTTLTAAPAEAAPESGISCYGDYCSGQYANATGCDKDATTLASAEVTVTDYRMGASVSSDPGISVTPVEGNKVGVIELRYSPTCKTKWARLETTRDSGINNVAVTQDTGYAQARHIGGFHTGSPAAISFSPMIYSPGNAAYAHADGADLVNQGTDWR